VSGGLAGTAKAGPGGGGPAGGPCGGGSGNYPVLAGGMSCEAAQASYSEEYKIGATGQPDLSAGAYGAVLNKGSYLNACGVPPSTSRERVRRRAERPRRRRDRATRPRQPRVAGCVASKSRGLPFPAHPRLDVTHTTFAGQ
jgi:hypothetical protein